jgi:hypothetical protein
MNPAQANPLQYLEQKKDDSVVAMPTNVANNPKVANNPDVDADKSPVDKSQMDKSPTHTYDYTYLHDSPLSQVFDFCVPDQAGKVAIPVYICIYQIVRSCSIEIQQNGALNKITMPFLKFLVEPKHNEMSFPSFEYLCDSSSSENNDTLFRNTCLMRLLEIIGPKEQKDAGVETLYDAAFKGMIYNDGALLVVFDYEIIQTHFVQPNTHQWAIVDEIVFESSIAGVPMDSKIVAIFRKNELLWNIVYSGGYVDFPHILYSVVNTSNTGSPVWKNELVEIATTTEDAVFRKSSLMIGQKTEDYVSGTVDGSTYGDRYLFSVHPIVAENLPQCKRYAVFVVGAKYILDKTFHAKYMEQRGMAVESEPKVVSPEDDDNETLEDLVPTIYFVETSGAATLMWGVRSVSQFEAI